MTRKHAYIGAALLFAAALPIQTVHADICDKLLAPDVTSLQTSRALAVSFLSQMTYEQFNQLEQSGGLNVPGYVKGNWAQTKANFTKESRSADFRWNEINTLNY